MCRAAGSQNPYQGVCGHLEVVGRPLNVDMAEVPVVGEEKKHRVTFCLSDLHATGAQCCLGGCHITESENVRLEETSNNHLVQSPCQSRNKTSCLAHSGFCTEITRNNSRQEQTGTTHTRQQYMGSKIETAVGMLLLNILTFIYFPKQIKQHKTR